MSEPIEDKVYNFHQLGGISYKQSWLDYQAEHPDWRPHDWYERLCRRFRCADYDILQTLSPREMATSIIEHFIYYDGSHPEDLKQGEDLGELIESFKESYSLPQDFECSDVYPQIVEDLAKANPHWLREMYVLSRGDSARCYPTPWTY